jgi:hypothetical protein
MQPHHCCLAHLCDQRLQWYHLQLQTSLVWLSSLLLLLVLLLAVHHWGLLPLHHLLHR